MQAELDAALVGTAPEQSALLGRMGGYRIPPEALLKDLMLELPFYEASGGGVTFSGGEPLLQWQFLREVLGQRHADDGALDVLAGLFRDRLPCTPVHIGSGTG